MSLIFNIAVTNVPVEYNFSTVQAVHKRLEYIRYGRVIPERDIPLEYIAFDPLKASEVLHIKDMSANFLNNNTKNTLNFDRFDTFVGKNYSSTTNKIIATSKSTVLENNVVYPYFYSHALPADTQNVTVQLVNNSSTTTVSSSLYVVEEDVLYAGFLNWFDEVSGRYNVYYIQSTDSSGNFNTEIYNPSYAFHEATFDDINPSTATLYADSNAYVLNTVGSNYVFTFPVAGTYYIKQLDISRIRLDPPALESADDPWIGRVTTGNFNQVIEGTSYNYYIEEYDLQLFVPSAPTKFTANENVIRITKNLLKLQRETVRIDPEGYLDIELIIADKKTDDVLYALTTDDNKSGTTYSDTEIEYNTTIISDWDENQGIVRLDGLDIKEDYEVRASYYYDTQHYEYSAIELNPVFNREVLDKLVVIYVVPDTKGSGENSVYHLIVRDNIILDCSQTGGTLVPNLSRYNDDGTINTSSIVGMYYSTTGESGSSSFSDLYPYYLVLAEITCLEPRRMHDAFRIDLRQNGGGINLDYLEEAIRNNPKIAYLPGIAPIGGYPYPQNATHVVEVPYTVLTDYGGELSENLVRTKVQTHMSAGEYPVIKYVGVIPEIYRITPGTCILLEWYREDPNYTFKIYRSLNIDSGFTLLTTAPASTYEDNTHQDCEVEPGIGYYYYITAINTETGIESPRSVIFGARAL